MKQIEQRLHDRIGLDCRTLGPSVLERIVRSRLQTLRLPSLSDYHALLESSPVEWDELVESVLVPETWFFRDREAFLALARLVRDLCQATPRKIRLLSLPCSTGEEPYSMAMTLLDAGLPAPRFHIDAADLSQRALVTAAQAVYGRNSFRGGDLVYRERHFERQHDRFVLSAAVRAPVRFLRGNLLDPTFLVQEPPYDIVFCRNLLIYFARATQARALQHLAHLLRPSSYLFVGAAELPVVLQHGFVSVPLPRAFACRKAGPPLPRRPSAVNVTLRKSIHPLADETQPQAEDNRPPARPTASAAIPRPAELIEAARRLADAGRLREAAGLCERHLELHGVSASVYYLLGLMDDAQGLASAAHYYRKALYLDPDHYESLVQMALLCARQGDAHTARVFQRRARAKAETKRIKPRREGPRRGPAAS